MIIFDLEYQRKKIISQKKEKVLINYINKNSQKMDQVTISSLAKENTVGYSVVYNLIKKLGFKGYREFIISLAAQETTFKALNREFFGDRSVLKEHYKKLMDLNDSMINYEELQRFINWIDDNRKALYLFSRHWSFWFRCGGFIK
ncbi:hypothetical protein [Spiroplasma endosymbiont of Nomada ruficornis]|uniref:hypothetical protein n=1 Tax=Spiroplasma endosymbiont of Nomada ruficornis TaxID=3066325 RepID=UPI00313DFDD4